MECNECGCDTDHEEQKRSIGVAKIMIDDLQEQNDKLHKEIAEARASAKDELSKLFALNHVPCDNPKCLCQTKEFEEYWKGAGIEKRVDD